MYSNQTQDLTHFKAAERAAAPESYRKERQSWANIVEIIRKTIEEILFESQSVKQSLLFQSNHSEVFGYISCEKMWLPFMRCRIFNRERPNKRFPADQWEQGKPLEGRSGPLFVQQHQTDHWCLPRSQPDRGVFGSETASFCDCA